MIVRDEGDTLDTCLDSLAPLAAEICIVDTGSVDRTPEIVQHRADRSACVPWCDDFSASRNASLALCTAPWILVLDADEIVSPAACREVKSAIASAPVRAWRYITRTYTRRMEQTGFTPDTSSDARGYPGWVPSHKVRLFPNRPDVGFSGTVHELVEPSLHHAAIPVDLAREPILHYPYQRSTDRQREKDDLYLRLGRKKAMDHPGDPQAHFELANQLTEAGRYREAIAAFRACLALDAERCDAWVDLGGVLYLEGHLDHAEHALQVALRLNEASSDGWRNLGVVLVAAGRPLEGGAAFERALALNPQWVAGPQYIAEARRQADRT